jgi:hypothetical protein
LPSPFSPWHAEHLDLKSWAPSISSADQSEKDADARKTRTINAKTLFIYFLLAANMTKKIAKW